MERGTDIQDCTRQLTLDREEDSFACCLSIIRGDGLDQIVTTPLHNHQWWERRVELIKTT